MLTSNTMRGVTMGSIKKLIVGGVACLTLAACSSAKESAPAASSATSSSTSTTSAPAKAVPNKAKRSKSKTATPSSAPAPIPTETPAPEETTQPEPVEVPAAPETTSTDNVRATGAVDCTNAANKNQVLDAMDTSVIYCRPGDFIAPGGGPMIGANNEILPQNKDDWLLFCAPTSGVSQVNKDTYCSADVLGFAPTNDPATSEDSKESFPEAIDCQEGAVNPGENQICGETQ